MDFRDLVDLIQVRNYVSGAVNNSAIDKKRAHSLNDIQVLLDKTIIDHLLSPEFKDAIGFEGVEQAVKEAALNNNIITKDVIARKQSSQSSIPAVAATVGHPIHIKPERI